MQVKSILHKLPFLIVLWDVSIGRTLGKRPSRLTRMPMYYGKRSSLPVVQTFYKDTNPEATVVELSNRLFSLVDRSFLSKRRTAVDWTAKFLAHFAFLLDSVEFSTSGFLPGPLHPSSPMRRSSKIMERMPGYYGKRGAKFPFTHKMTGDLSVDVNSGHVDRMSGINQKRMPILLQNLLQLTKKEEIVLDEHKDFTPRAKALVDIIKNLMQRE